MLLIHGMASSRRTWWRVARELEARDWVVETVDLAGHDGRPVGAARSVSDLAEDVRAQRPTGCTLVAGHSLGAIVALELVTAAPSYAAGVLLEDPPGKSDRRAARVSAADAQRETDETHEDPSTAIDSLLRGHPTWSRRDARTVVEGRLLTDPRIAHLPPGALAWDLPTLVSGSPVPVALVAAVGAYSVLAQPERDAVLRQLPSQRVTELPTSHHVHLDDPTSWVDAVDAFGASLPEASTT